MICAIGIDSIEIKRFVHWHTYSIKQLSRIFSVEEITYCLSVPTKSAERFAVRFAAKEAFYKAFSTIIAPNKLSLLFLCRNVAITKDKLYPKLGINWTLLFSKINYNAKRTFKSHCSLTHTKDLATAIVILERGNL